MEEQFYKVTKEDAAKLVKEWVDADGIHRRIEATNEQDDGTLLIPKSEYEKIKDDTEVKKIDWTKKTLITKEQIVSKNIEEVISDGGNDLKGK